MAQATSDTERTVTRISQEVWSEGNLDVLSELMASDIGGQLPGIPELRTREDYKEAVQTYRAAFPDFDVEVTEIVSTDDVVTIRYTVRGTHEGELMGIAPTGTEVEMNGSAIIHLEDGRVVEEWNYGDMISLLQQVGAMPQQQSS